MKQELLLHLIMIEKIQRLNITQQKYGQSLCKTIKGKNKKKQKKVNNNLVQISNQFKNYQSCYHYRILIFNRDSQHLILKLKIPCRI